MLNHWTVEYLTALRARTTAELDEINASSHPLRSEFVKGWQKRLQHIDGYIAERMSLDAVSH